MLLPPSSLPFITAKGINISLLWAHKALCEFYLIFVCMSVTWHHPSIPAMEGGKAKHLSVVGQSVPGVVTFTAPPSVVQECAGEGRVGGGWGWER